MIRWMFTGRRWIGTLIVLLAAAVMIRLGIWQIDRLKQREALNAHTEAQMSAPALDLNNPQGFAPGSLAGMEYRSVTITGTYDFSQQVALRDQVINSNQVGVDLLTPLKIAGTNQAILVDRGWISEADFQTGNFAKFNEPGTVTVKGVIRQSQNLSFLGLRKDPPYVAGQPRVTAFFSPNVARIGQQVPYSLLPVYVQETPNPAWTGQPQREPLVVDLSNGPHLNYTIQWFSFTAILLIGYVIFIKRQMESKQASQPNVDGDEPDDRLPGSGEQKRQMDQGGIG